MQIRSKGMGGIFDKYGSHSDEISRRKGASTGFRMSHTPGVTKHCKCCKQQKPNKGHNTRSGAFICMDCKALAEKYKETTGA